MKRKKIFLTLLTLTALMVGQTAWAQDLSGSGTKTDPWVINNVDDWNTFASSSDYWEMGTFVKLAADIPTAEDITAGKSITTTVESFQGTFDGCGHTLTLNLDETGKTYLAPFRSIEDATIKRLHTAGSITTDNQMAGGIVGDCNGDNSKILSCWSSVTINSSIDGDGTHGGLVGRLQGYDYTQYKLTITDCLFDGSITYTGTDQSNKTNSCGGFVGWKDEHSTLNLYHCLQAGDLTGISSTDGATFCRFEYNNSTVDFTTCYYRTAYGTAQGTKTNETGDNLKTQLGDGWEVSGNDVFPIMTVNPLDLTEATISGVKAHYKYTGSEITVTCTVKDADGNTLTKDTHYTVAFSPTPVKELGNYTLTITAKDGNTAGYFGSLSVEFEVWPWADDAINGGYCGDPTVNDGKNVYYEYTEGTYSNKTLTIKGTGAMADYEDSSASPWVNSNSDIYNVPLIIIIEDGVTTIGKKAFNGYHYLKAVTIPSSVNTIGQEAFSGCSQLTSIAIPGSGTTSIGQKAFSGCSGMELVAIGEGVTSIGEDAFKGCTGVKDVYCYADPANLTWTDSGPDDFKTDGSTKCHVSDADDWSTFVGNVNVDFEGDLMDLTSGDCGATGNESGVQWSCNLSTETLTISGAGAMADYADQYGNSIYTPWKDYLHYIKKVVIGDGITYLGNYAFYNGIYITSVTFNASNTDISIGDGTFYNCCRLESITIPANVTSIGISAFEQCYKMTTVNFADGSKLKTIGDRAFSSCEELKSITIPACVTSIGEGAFAGCRSLTSIGVDASNNYYTNVDGVLFSKDGKTLVAYPIGKTNTEYSIPDEVTTIGACAFYGCGKLKTVTFGSGSQLTTIGKEAFEECDKLETINNLPTSIIYVGYNAFEYTPWFDDKFQNLTNGGSICIGSVLYRAKITTSSSYTVADKIVGIADGAFNDCSNLKTVTIPASVTYIGDFAFNDCENLETVTFNGTSKLETIGTEAFAVTGLTEITIPASVTSIGWGAFYYCENLATVTFADNSQLKNIDMGAFSGCGIQAITIPASVTTIGDGAFYGCGNLATIYVLPVTPPTLGNYTFLDIDANCKFYVHGYAYESASGWNSLNATPIGSVSCANGIKISPDAFFTYDGKNYYPQGIEMTISGGNSGEPPYGCKNEFVAYTLNRTPNDNNTFIMPPIDVRVDAFWEPIEPKGKGTKEEPYIIVYPSQLDAIALDVNYNDDFDYKGVFFKLGNDITYSYAGYGPTESNYTPIGTIELKLSSNPGNQLNNPNAISQIAVPVMKYFNGTFDGDGKTISGIRLYPESNDQLSGSFQALFGLVGPNGTVKNVNIEDTQIAGIMGIGGIAGMNAGTIENCTSRAIITAVESDAGGMEFGGIVGYSKNGIIRNCFSFATIAIGDNAKNYGGIGGIAGRNETDESEGSTPATIENCTSSATITIGNSPKSCGYIGGIVGENTDGVLTGNLAINVEIPEVNTGVEKVGAIIGAIVHGYNNTNYSDLKNNYYSGCTVEGVVTNSGIGCGDFEDSITDIADNDGAVPALAFYDSGTKADDNETVIYNIANNNSNTVNALLFGRTLVKDGSWNTLCLPFAVTAAQLAENTNPLYGATVMELDITSTESDGITKKTRLDGTTLYLNFTSVTSIEAGKPYIVKWAKNDPSDPDLDNIVNPVFSGVTIVNPFPMSVVEFQDVSFLGNYSPYTVKADDEIIYLGSGNKIGYAKAGKVLRSFRAHFDMKLGTNVKEINLIFDDSDENAADAISLTPALSEGEGEIYNLAGQRLQKMQKGINIVNGKKILF